MTLTELAKKAYNAAYDVFWAFRLPAAEDAEAKRLVYDARAIISSELGIDMGGMTQRIKSGRLRNSFGHYNVIADSITIDRGTIRDIAAAEASGNTDEWRDLTHWIEQAALHEEIHEIHDKRLKLSASSALGMMYTEALAHYGSMVLKKYDKAYITGRCEDEWLEYLEIFENSLGKIDKLNDLCSKNATNFLMVKALKKMKKVECVLHGRIFGEFVGKMAALGMCDEPYDERVDVLKTALDRPDTKTMRGLLEPPAERGCMSYREPITIASINEVVDSYERDAKQ
jgi:hypothetical protein